MTYQHWQLNKDADNIVWLWIDRNDSHVNSLNKVVLEEFERILQSLSADKSVRGLIIGSKKKSGFIAGADIEQFTKLQSVDEATDLIRHGQLIFNQLAALTIPTVAMIDGFCLGGGLELALACRYRVAEDGEKTKIGLPEVLLGIHPGWGGTVRLPTLIGALPALDLILTGRALNANACAKLGIIDAAVPKRHLERAARYFILQKPAVYHPSFLKRLVNHKSVRPWVAKILYKKVGSKASRNHYPAPYAVIDHWVRDGAEGDQAMLNEAKSIGELLVGNTARNLVRVFFLQERLKGLAKGIDFKAQHVHVIGAGVMGGDIAAWCALRGCKVTLQDRAPEFIAPAIKRAYDLFKKKLKKPRLIQAAMDRLIPDVEGVGVPQADVLIEAVSENVELKQKIFHDLETRAKESAILATNTSSIPLAEIGANLKKPERLVGIHFFNPVAKMPLVEVVHDVKTSETIVQKATAFVRQIDRLPLPVKSSPGFLVNRILMPYLMEAMRLLQEGHPREQIDKAALNFGMPMGPIELADTVGLDVCLHVAKHLSHDNADNDLLEKLAQMVNAKQLGRKSGLGFYVYKNGKPEKVKVDMSAIEEKIITDRLLQKMLDEAHACLKENVVQDADLLDAGMIFGTGFAPFRGGLLHYEKTRS